MSQTLESLVYAAPFVAPLAYAGVGLLLILERLEPQPRLWARWVLFLALGGLVGNFGLSLTDHAINGFFHPAEWIPVVAGGLATGFVAVLLLRPDDAALRASTWVVLAGQGLVGVAGFVLHLLAPSHGWGTDHQSLVHGAPIFAPLLFPNVAALAAFGVVELERGASGLRDGTSTVGDAAPRGSQ